MEKLHDRDIREPLFGFLEETYGRIRILEEKTMGKSRADIVMVTPEYLYGIEIKSDADTYARLARQVKDYDSYYDYNIVVVGSSHALHIEEHVPDYWGIITVEVTENCFDFYILRKAAANPKMKWKRKLEILWRPELAQLQEWNAMPKYKEKSKSFVTEKILERIPEKIDEETLRQQISELLMERDYNTVAETLAEYRKGEKTQAYQKDMITALQRRKRKMSLISGIHHVAFKCRNEEEYKETIHFYKDVLGLTVVRSWETGTMLDTGEGLIEIFNNGEDPKEQGVIRHFALETEDVESCVRVVREAGYEVFIEPKDIVIASEPPFPARIAFCRGPLQEEIEFFQEKK